MSNTHDSIALLIDADNAPAARMDFIISELASHGIVNIRKAYGNWTKKGLSGWEKILHEHSIQPVQLFDLTKGKNATDMALLIDAMDILYTKQVDTFCLVTSDCDFTPLAQRLRADAKKVIGFGGKKTPEPFVNSCSHFLYLDQKPTTTKTAEQKKSSAKELKGNTKLMNTLRSAVASAQDDEGWARLGPVGSHISNQGPFDHRTYGYAKLSDLFNAIDLFEIRATKKGEQKIFEVRLQKSVAKKAAKKAAKKSANMPD